MIDHALLKEICDLNAQGVLALTHGTAGKTSVALIRQAMLSMDQVCATAPDVPLTLEPPMSFRTIPVSDLRDEHFYIFSHAFSLDLAPNTQEFDSTSLAFCCAVLTFNMALTYHQLGHREGSSKKLRAACHLYGNCVEMVSSVSSPPTPGDNLFLLQMMAMNNASQIQYSLAKFSESNHLLSHVRQMMHQISEQSMEELEDTGALAYLPSEALDEVNLNGVVCLHPPTAPTA